MAELTATVAPRSSSLVALQSFTQPSASGLRLDAGRAQVVVRCNAVLVKEVAKRLPHVVVEWSPNYVFFVVCKEEGGGKEVVRRAKIVSFGFDTLFTCCLGVPTRTAKEAGHTHTHAKSSRTHTLAVCGSLRRKMCAWTAWTVSRHRAQPRRCAQKTFRRAETKRTEVGCRSQSGRRRVGTWRPRDEVRAATKV